jgi:hypothetical protein
VSFQLKFLEGEGDSDKVVIYDEAGKELAAHADMQHNKNYGQLRQNNAAMSQKVLVALGVEIESLLQLNLWYLGLVWFYRDFSRVPFQ